MHTVLIFIFQGVAKLFDASVKEGGETKECLIIRRARRQQGVCNVGAAGVPVRAFVSQANVNNKLCIPDLVHHVRLESHDALRR